MVILKDLFDLLAAGEFANIALSRDQTGSVKESEYPKVISHINLGVMELHKRFKFMQAETTFNVTVGDNDITLSPNLNIIEILGIFNSEGTKLVLNNRFKTPAITQLSEYSLSITGVETADTYTILYQSYPQKITIESDFDAETIDIPIPATVIEPLLFYIAARVYKPMGSNDSTANADKSSAYQQQYELACQKIELYGLDPQDDDDDIDDRFHDEGWA